MLPNYADIIDRAGDPDWWDEVGCPRYGAFSPERCRVYNEIIGLYLIKCQICPATFKVAMGLSMEDKVSRVGKHRMEFPDPVKGFAGFHYGDPPPHGDCAGSTMNCEELEILSFWGKKMFGWERLPLFEGKIISNYEGPSSAT